MPIATWKTATIAHTAKLKAQLPGWQIIFTEFQSMPANGGRRQRRHPRDRRRRPRPRLEVHRRRRGQGGNH